MKRFMFSPIGFLCLAIALVPITVSSVSAILPPIGCIGLFADAVHQNHTVCPPLYAQFQCWIWCLPSVNGLQATEFAVKYPATVINFATVKNPLITIELGTLTAGISVAFGEGMCQMDWVWLYQLTLIAIGSIAETKVDIIPRPGTPGYQFVTCLPGYPIEPCIYLGPIYICWPVGVEQTNWGAIKSLF